jgi:indole-3-glycerol phosphate synthase
MKQSSMLKKILATKRHEIQLAKKAMPLDAMKDALTKAPPTRGYVESIRRRRSYQIHLIAEIKKASPSVGLIRPKMDVTTLAKDLENAGASALSVLTETRYFQGSPDNLMLAKKGCSLPVLRKDFIIDEYQIYESRLIGADAMLIIVRLLNQKALKTFITLARNLSITPVVEVHTVLEVKRALDAGAEVIMVNTRDLGSFHVDFDLAATVRPKIPEGVVAICASGVSTTRQIDVLRSLKFDAVLIGEALMRSRDPRALVHELLHT